MNKLDVGFTFDSHAEFLSAKQEYEKSSNTILITSKAEKLKPTDAMSQTFRYQRFTLLANSSSIMSEEQISENRIHEGDKN